MPTEILLRGVLSFYPPPPPVSICSKIIKTEAINLKKQSSYFSMNKNKISRGFYYSFENLDKYDSFRNFISTNKVDTNSILGSLNISGKDCVYTEQVHGNDIAVVSDKDKCLMAKGVDALITNTPNLCLCIRTADCLPLILFDPNKNVLTVIHAGWRGTLKNISANSVKKMVTDFNISPKDLIVGIGPHIILEDYLVKLDVASKFIKSGYKDFLKKVTIQEWKLDLAGINIKQLREMGIEKDNIEISKISTFRSKDFYSYRRGDVGEFITGGVIYEQ